MKISRERPEMCIAENGLRKTCPNRRQPCRHDRAEDDPAQGMRDQELKPVLVFSLYDGTLYYPYPIAMLAVSIAVILGDRRGDDVQAGTRPR
jgi:hypothetical protein